LRGIEDEPCVLLGRSHAIGDVLLIEAGVTCQVGLLGLHIAIDGVLSQLLLVLVVLAVEARRYLPKVLGEGVLGLLHGIVVGTTTERPIGGELSRQRRRGVLVVAVHNALLRLVHHLAEIGVLSGVLVRPHLRRLSREGIGTRVDAVLAAQDLLQGVLLILLAAELTRCALLG